MNADRETLDLLFPEVKEDFLSPKFERPYVLRRWDRGDDRLYHIFSDTGQIIKSYMSGTTFCGKVLPITDGLKRYIGNRGYEDSIKNMKLLAERGTVFHIEALSIFKNNGDYSFREFEKRLPDMLPYWCRDYHTDWAEGLKRSLLCWFLFVKERVKEVYAIEMPLRSDEWGLAVTLDSVFGIEFNKSIVPAIVDLKSGLSGFWPAHELQLKIQRECWNETFPQFPIEHLFNWSPVDYRKEVTYKFQNQTKAMTGKATFKGVEIEQWQLHLLQGQAGALIRPPSKFETIWGDFNIKDFDPLNHSFIYK